METEWRSTRKRGASFDGAAAGRRRHRDRPAGASLASLPLELFYGVVAYLGPTSASLCALAGVTREHRAIVTTIGDVMLRRAHVCFRVPLPPRSDCESSISLFVRHARASKAVHDRLRCLEGVLGKGFPAMDTEEVLVRRDDAHREPKFEPSEVERALNVALCLLGCPRRRYFDDPKEAQEIATNAGTTALEWRISSLCGELGDRAYKYAKSRMCHSHDELFSEYAVWDEMSLDDDSEFDDEELSVDSGLIEAYQDMAILDKACMVIQHVALREERRVAGRSSYAPLAAVGDNHKIGGVVGPQHAYA